MATVPPIVNTSNWNSLVMSSSSPEYPDSQAPWEHLNNTWKVNNTDIKNVLEKMLSQVD